MHLVRTPLDSGNEWTQSVEPTEVDLSHLSPAPESFSIGIAAYTRRRPKLKGTTAISEIPRDAA